MEMPNCYSETRPHTRHRGWWVCRAIPTTGKLWNWGTIPIAIESAHPQEPRTGENRQKTSQKHRQITAKPPRFWPDLCCSDRRRSRPIIVAHPPKQREEEESYLIRVEPTFETTGEVAGVDGVLTENCRAHRRRTSEFQAKNQGGLESHGD